MVRDRGLDFRYYCPREWKREREVGLGTILCQSGEKAGKEESKSKMNPAHQAGENYDREGCIKGLQNDKRQNAAISCNQKNTSACRACCQHKLMGERYVVVLNGLFCFVSLFNPNPFFGCSAFFFSSVHRHFHDHLKNLAPNI